eukprot:c18882_g1_i2 orf=172-1596(+)
MALCQKPQRIIGKFTGLVKGHLLYRNYARIFSSWLSPGQSALDVGQPTSKTHPELLSNDEIMPGITANDFASRREKLMELLPTGSLVIINSSSVQQMTDVVPYPFHQDGDYLYYTGCQQPGGVAVIDDQAHLFMFMQDPDIEREAWEGHLAGIPEALNIFKANQAYHLSQLPQVLPKMIEQTKLIYHNAKPISSVYENLLAFRKALQGKRVHNLQQYSHQCRWIKSDSEISLMRQSASITCQAFLQTMKVSKTSPCEHFLAATVEYECKIRGAQSMAYPSVVAAGANGTIIHYSRHDQRVRGGEMVLMDAGCEHYGYASDVTRTWPPFGSFSTSQREVYEIVLSTMKECLKMCHPGSTLEEINEYSADLLLKELLKLGLIEGSYKKKWRETLLAQQYLQFNPTTIGHFLGLDVHDCNMISKKSKFQPGVVITIEPGLYISVKEDIPKRFFQLLCPKKLMKLKHGSNMVLKSKYE